MSGKAVKHADLAHFERLFARSEDPWGTRHRHDEAFKRAVILKLLPPHRVGRLLELGCGNGSNSTALARSCLTLDACDGSSSAVRLTAQALHACAHARVHHVELPSRFPRRDYDAIVVSELLYYLPERVLLQVLREIRHTLRRGGWLVLCHHHVQFGDACQLQTSLHDRVTRNLGDSFKLHRHVRHARWEALCLRMR